MGPRSCWGRDEKAAPTRAIGFILEGGKKLERKFRFECVMTNLTSTDAVVVGMYDKFVGAYVLEHSETSMRRLR